MNSIFSIIILFIIISVISSIIRGISNSKGNPFERFTKKGDEPREYDENGNPVFKKKNVNMGKFPGKMVLLVIVVILIALSTMNAYYTIDQSEQALIFRFGAHHKTVTTPGLNFKIPFIDTVEFVNTEEIRRIEYGFRSNSQESSFFDEYRSDNYSDIYSEKIMITGDENLVEVEVIVQYKVIDPEAYILNVDAPKETLELAAYSRIRRVVANHNLDDVLTLNKAVMQQEMLEDIQEISNKYGLGVLITTVQLQDVDPPDAVAAAFTDVASAKEDKEKYINEANQYFNKIIPEARAQKEKLLNEATAYKTVRINQAQGDVARFTQILEKYKEATEITKTRMYIETMQEILPGMDIYIVDGDNITMLPVSGADTSAAKAVVGATAGQ
ncbi:membrane protease subunit HflK [Dethiosulfatibacter aminovorans DSM 17477]|uniref:Protein HflK n=1 Tax=Dethiosulfatibacter aminovorans DSM 17477 TaxID=1121476 RepID=A0A1M6H377_9FIRM|nr:FtsH protease activity modulator HflK [Dethiosulfatibacter aminovorans]SHJ16609.1 membrane protease subunit HflK [Dethiosulfatibacter aminovorans DSM 17477]